MINNIDIKYITTKKLAEKLNKHPETLRQWEKDYCLRISRDKKNHRIYTQDIDKIFTRIIQLHELGKSVEETRNILVKEFKDHFSQRLMPTLKTNGICKGSNDKKKCNIRDCISQEIKLETKIKELEDNVATLQREKSMLIETIYIIAK